MTADPEVSQYLRKILAKFEELQLANGHLSTADHAHIHRHLGELWGVGVDVNVGGASTLSVVVNNPSNSGNVVEVVLWSVGLDDQAKVTFWKDADIYTGNNTAITPRSFGGASDGDQTFNAEHGAGIVNTGSDNQWPGGFHSSSSGFLSGARGSSASRPGLDVVLDEGEDFAVHIDPAADVNPLVEFVLSEYTVGRSIES